MNKFLAVKNALNITFPDQYLELKISLLDFLEQNNNEKLNELILNLILGINHVKENEKKELIKGTIKYLKDRGISVDISQKFVDRP